MTEKQAPQQTLVDLDHLPEIDLRHFLALTDGTGMFQHALFGSPDYHHGYCIDDNCRALIASVIYRNLAPDAAEPHVPMQRYLAFISYAFNPEKRQFRNFMSFDRKWLEEVGSEDSHARTLWALGTAVRRGPNDDIRLHARRLFHDALPAAENFPYIRSWAFTLIGIDEFLAVEPEDQHTTGMRALLAEKLFERYQAAAVDDWPWWENVVTYDNAKLSHALLLSGEAMGREDMKEAALTSLRWLIDVQTAEDGRLSIIGNQGWMTRSGIRAHFDQQPLEAHAVVHASLVAARITGDGRWVEHALRGVRWFLGENDLGLPLYNSETGGCHDGLLDGSVNANQGAESTLAYLLSVLELHQYVAEPHGSAQTR